MVGAGEVLFVVVTVLDDVDTVLDDVDKWTTFGFRFSSS